MSKKPSAIDASTVLATKEKSPGARSTGALQRGQTVTETLVDLNFKVPADFRQHFKQLALNARLKRTRRDALSGARHRAAREGVVRTGRRLRRAVVPLRAQDAAVGEQLDASQVPRIYKRMARRAGLPDDIVDTLVGHSTRVGPVQDMIACGIELPAILQSGRWQTTRMVQRYWERLLARRSGAAQLAERQKR